jgi:hypothetical protein
MNQVDSQISCSRTSCVALVILSVVEARAATKGALRHKANVFLWQLRRNKTVTRGDRGLGSNGLWSI